MKTLFIKYLKVTTLYGATHPVGVIVAENPSNIGWSLCSLNDHFSYKMAKRIAEGRLVKHPKKLPPEEMILFIRDAMPEIERWYANQLARDA